MDLKDVIKNINDAKEQLQKSVDIEKSEQDAEQQEEADKSVEPKTKEEAGGKAPVEKSEVEDKEAPEDDSEDHEDHDDDEEEHEDDEESSEDDVEKACNVEDNTAEKSCGDKKVAKSDDSEDDGADDEVEACDQRTKSSDIDKSVFMQQLEMFENLSKSYVDLANSSIELAQSVFIKFINDTNNQEVVEKSVEPEPEDKADSETQAEDDDVEKSVAPEAESEVPVEKGNVEKSAEPEPEADDVEKSMPKGKSFQYADDAPEDDDIEKSVDSDEVKVSELKDAVAKSIQGLQGYVLMNREQGMLKSLLHKVDELDPDDVAPKELVDAYNKI